MNQTNNNPNLQEVATVVEGLTGRKFTPAEYQQHLVDAQDSRRSGRFICGPIPVSWMERVIKNGTPSALSTSLALIYLRGLNRSNTFRIEPARFRELGIDDTARRRGLRDLVNLGLLALESRVGRAPVASLLEFPSPGADRESGRASGRRDPIQPWDQK